MGEHIETRAVHAGREDLSELGVHAPPLDLSSTYPFKDLGDAVDAFDAFAAGRDDAREPIYGRLHNPTTARFERGLAGLEGTETAVAFASGMAALTASLLAIRGDRSHVVAFRPLYGGSDHLLDTRLLDLDVTWIVDEHELPAALRPETGLVLLETPQNPTLGQLDIADTVARAGHVPVLVDNTFATPVLQNPAAHGAQLVLHSATKFIGGHGDVVAGVMATSEEWARRLRRVRTATGGILHPLAAYLLHRGLPTLPLRVRAAQAGAHELARRLAGHAAVTRVLYPALPGCDPKRLLGRQLRGGGAIVSFELRGGLAAAEGFLESVRLATPAVSLGSTDTLVEHPAGLTHRLVDERAKAAAGVTDGLVRVSVGLEHVDDLWADFAQALAATQQRALIR